MNEHSVARARKVGLTPAEADRLGQLLGLLSDPVRLRAMFCFAEVDELCVGDLAMALGVTPDQSSYALRNLKAVRLVQTRRAGRVIYYRLADNFPQQMLQHCLRQLLHITKEG